jgi:hypothetical protein
MRAMVPILAVLGRGFSVAIGKKESMFFFEKKN